MEVEAKFSIPDRDTFDRLCQLGHLAGYRLAPGGVKLVHDCYLDTDDQAILRGGYACRVRHKTVKTRLSSPRSVAQWDAQEETGVATLKGLGGADAGSGIHRRTEYEVVVDKGDPTTWPESPARDLALQLSDGRPLRQLFVLRQERHLRLLYDDAPEGARRVAELSLDLVTPSQQDAPASVGGGKVGEGEVGEGEVGEGEVGEGEVGEGEPHPYYELEIELLEQGGEPDLDALADNLRTAWGLRPEPRSKFERGLEFVDAVAHRNQGRN